MAGIDHDYREVACEELGRTCMAVPAAGWEGPLALFIGVDGSEPYLCPNDEAGTVFGADLVVDASADPCACQPPADACTIDVSITPKNSCVMVLASAEDIPTNLCFALNITDKRVTAHSGDLEEVACAATGLPLPDARWRTRARLCSVAPTALGRCDDGEVCQAPVPRAQLCILQRGETSCPAGPFAVRRVFYEDMTDTRRCECGVVSGECGGQVGFFATLADCDNHGFVQAAGAVDTCMGPITAKYVEYRASTAVTTCAIAPEDAYQGEVVAANPVTVCCQADGHE